MKQKEINDSSIIPMSCACCMDPVGALDCPISEKNIGEVLLKKKVNPVCVTCAKIIMSRNPHINKEKARKVLAYLERTS